MAVCSPSGRTCNPRPIDGYADDDLFGWLHNGVSWRTDDDATLTCRYLAFLSPPTIGVTSTTLRSVNISFHTRQTHPPHDFPESRLRSNPVESRVRQVPDVDR